MTGRLERSRDERIIAGVCGGLGEYLHVDPMIVRVVMVVVTLMGPGALLYLILWAILPLASPPPPASV